MSESPLRVTVWHEHRHDNPDSPEPNAQSVALYPGGMHAHIKSAIEEHLGAGVAVTTCTLDQDPDHGLSDTLLAHTDVMVWWGHAAHDQVQDVWADKVAQRVREGMGLVVLHSAHYAKPFIRLMGTACHLTWRDTGEKERLWAMIPGHPITAGLTGACIEIPRAEMYGEHFDIPDPDELVFVSWFEGGEVFRSGCVWRRGAGKVFYFRPGHETFPIYHHPDVRRVLANGVRYVAPTAPPPIHAAWNEPKRSFGPERPDDTVPYRNGSPQIAEPAEPVRPPHGC